MTLSALPIQLLNGLASASSLFLLAAGLTLIFGVTRIVNFAHGSLYMLGAYVAYSAIERFGANVPGYWLSVLGASLAVGTIGAAVEIVVLRRIYRAPELLQLIATFGVVLIVADAVLALWGPEDLLGPLAAGFRGTLAIAGGVLPQYDALLIAVGPVVLLVLWWLVRHTRWGVLVRAASENRVLVQALGIDQAWLFTSVFFAGAALAGLAGGLQLPRESAHLGMDLSVIAEAFVVTVVGGLGSIPGAFIAALLIGLTRALCIALGDVEVAGLTVAFSRLTLVIEFVVMALVLAVKPHGLLGRAPPHAPTTPLAEQRALVRPAGRRSVIAALVALALATLLPLVGDEYDVVLATDVLVFALFAASLQLLLGTGGLASFGHAAYFGLGAYAAAVAARHGAPLAAAIALAPVVAALGALAFGWFCVRLSGIYLAMLTLAFAQIVWSIAFQWDSFTGGSNGLVGVWPPALLAGKSAYFHFTLALVGLGLASIAWLAQTPFGYALRAARDAPLRAEASGIDARATQWTAFAFAGALAGLAGALYAFSKGSISPETLAIPRSIDALVMVLLGGLNTLAGPLLGAAAFIGLQDTLSRATEYWRAGLGAAILLLVTVFPMGLGGWVRRLLERIAR
ncbi:MAG TPA: ABC transporter permease [Casimicrobiaceae bacterium]|nr:ABC transporter permease [Casimicrobiaceae bacterium]